jgi:hypothetical protein
MRKKSCVLIGEASAFVYSLVFFSLSVVDDDDDDDDDDDVGYSGTLTL